MVAAFAAGSAPETFKADHDMSWFTLVNGVLVDYPSWLNWAWLGLAALLLAAYIALALKKGMLKLKRLWLAAWLLGAALGAAAIGTGVAYLLSLAFGLPFRLMNLVGVPGFVWVTVASAALVLAVLVLIFRRRLKRGWTFEELTASASLLSVVMAAIFTAALPGGAFLFSFGAIFACVFGILALRWKPFRLFTGFVACWIAAPVIALLLIALTPGSLGIVLLFACFPLALVAAGMAEATVPKQ